MNKRISLIGLITVLYLTCSAQVLTLKEAVQAGIDNYGLIKAKSNYAEASRASLQQSKREYLPNLSLSAQQVYGTVNGQNGPLYGFGGLGVASSGLPLPEQNWNAAFGALYLANINWDFFTFGKAKARVEIASAALHREEADLYQEQFQHQVRISSAYLNLLAAQRLSKSQQMNLERAMTFRNNVVARSRNGLIAGVDSSLANAEVSNATIALTRAKDTEQEQANRLAVLMGKEGSSFLLDTSFVSRIPATIADRDTNVNNNHPALKFYSQRIAVSEAQSRFFRRLALPNLTFFAVNQFRGSGFSAGYTQDQTAYNKNYVNGITPTRGNYLVGIGVNWNLTNILRTNAQAKAQEHFSEGLKNEYDLVNQQLAADKTIADNKIKNALSNYHEVSNQVNAARDAYHQKSVLYQNGLTTLVDVTQALYTLNRAETDRDIIYTNVWQALLLKAASSGDISIFMNEL